MNKATRPQAATPDQPEKQEIPWRVQFTSAGAYKDILAACWGNQKMAGVLYHLLCVGSWKAHNNGVDKSEKVYILQESHAEILAKLKLKISEPTLISYLKVFAAVGYVRKAARKEAQEIHFDVIERAFISPPDKPIPGTNLSSDLSLNANLKEEQEMLRQEVAKLAAEVQDLSLTLVRLKFTCAQIEQEFKLNFSSTLVHANLNQSSESALEADAEDHVSIPLLDSKSIENLEKRESEKGNSAVAPLPHTHPFAFIDLDLLSEDCSEAQPLSYSHNKTTTTVFQASLETVGFAVGAGYMQNQCGVKQPEKPVKGIRNAAPKQPPEPKPIKPLMPPPDAKWCPEIALQIVEAKLGKYYRQAARDKQLNFAKRMFKDDPELTREQFIAAYDERNDDWWHTHKGLLHMQHMVEKDRVHEMLDRIEGRKSAPSKPAQSQEPARRTPGQKTNEDLKAMEAYYLSLPPGNTKRSVAQ